VSYRCPTCGAVSHNPNDEQYRYCAVCHRFEDEPPAGGTLVQSGEFWGRWGRSGRLERASPADGPPDEWICRRVEDFPAGQVPARGAVTHCTRCQAAIVFNPARVGTVPADTPKVCMQCAGIRPLPIPQ
jgi:hypothetical protein